jgi:hypothetical protein
VDDWLWVVVAGSGGCGIELFRLSFPSQVPCRQNSSPTKTTKQEEYNKDPNDDIIDIGKHCGYQSNKSVVLYKSKNRMNE